MSASQLVSGSPAIITASTLGAQFQDVVPLNPKWQDNTRMGTVEAEGDGSLLPVLVYSIKASSRVILIPSYGPFPAGPAPAATIVPSSYNPVTGNLTPGSFSFAAGELEPGCGYIWQVWG